MGLKTKITFFLLSCGLASMAGFAAGKYFAVAESKRMQLVSPVFKNGDLLPKDYVCNGLSKTPPFEIKNPPEGTSSFMMMTYRPMFIPKDPSLWILYDMPARVTILPDSLLPGKLGFNLNAKQAFDKPCTKGPEAKYVTVVYALDIASVVDYEPIDFQKFKMLVEEHALSSASIEFYLKNPPASDV